MERVLPVSHASEMSSLWWMCPRPSAASRVGLQEPWAGSPSSKNYFLIKSWMQLAIPFLLRLNIPSRLPETIYLIFYLVATTFPTSSNEGNSHLHIAYFFPRHVPWIAGLCNKNSHYFTKTSYSSASVRAEATGASLVSKEELSLSQAVGRCPRK